MIMYCPLTILYLEGRITLETLLLYSYQVGYLHTSIVRLSETFYSLPRLPTSQLVICVALMNTEHRATHSALCAIGI